MTHKTGTYAMVTNNILGPYGNAVGTGLSSAQAETELSYTSLDGVENWVLLNAKEGPGCLEGNAKFVDAAAGNYNLQPDSPCKDAGHPTMKDPDGSPSDMGVHGGPLAK